MTVPGQFGTSLENQLRGHGFAIFPSDSSSGLRIGYVLDEIIGEITPTGYLQIRTSDGTAFSMIRRLIGGLPSTSQTPALPAPASAPEEPVPGTPVVTHPAHIPEPAPAVKEAPLPEVPQTPVPQAPTPHKEESSRASGDSRRMPIITAVRTVIPVKWQYSIQGTELRQKQVPYPKNIPWRKALMDMATATDSTVDINAKARLVTFTPKGTPSAPATTQSAVAAPVSSESPVVATALADAAATSKSAPATTNTPAPRQRRKLRPRPSRPLQPSPSLPSLSPFPNGTSRREACARSWMFGQAVLPGSSFGTRTRISTCRPAPASEATSLPPLLSFLKASTPPDSHSGQRSIPQTTFWK